MFRRPSSGRYRPIIIREGQPGKIKKKKRRQDTCCYKYGPRAWIRKLTQCICRRFTRCFKKKIFGVPDPKLNDYEIAGHTVSSYKNMLKLDETKISSLKNDFSFNDSMPWYDKISKLNESKPISDKTTKFNESTTSEYYKNLPPLRFKSTGTVSTLFRNRKSLPLANLSLKDLQLIDGYSARELKKKFYVTGSKAELLDELVKEYKKGNLSMSGISKQSKYREKELDGEKLDKIIKQYEKVRRKSVANIYQFKYMDKEDLKKRFSLSGSKGKVFNQMIDDYRNGKLSLKNLTNSRTEPKKLNKDQMNEMLKAYEDRKRSKKVHFPSKFELFKPYYDNVKDNISLSSLKDKYAKLFSKPAY